MSRSNISTSIWPSSSTVVLTGIVLGSLLTLAWLISRTPASSKPIRENLEASDGEIEAAAAARSVEDDASLQLSLKYQVMHETFGRNGFSSSEIITVSSWFSFPSSAQEVPMPRPRNYSEFQPIPLPPNSVRLLVIPLESSPSIAALGVAITRDVVKALAEASPKTVCWNNQRIFYHITIFHTSHPHSIRPSPFDPNGGVEGEQAAGKDTLNVISPSKEVLVKEEEALRDILAEEEPPVLEIDRVLMTSGGTLIVAWIDRQSRVQQLRQKLRSTFPGASSKQSSIIHTSLSRVVSKDGSDLPPLDSPAVKRIQSVCDKWTEKLRGKTFTPSAFWFIFETTFSTIEGPMIKFDLKKPM